MLADRLLGLLLLRNIFEDHDEPHDLLFIAQRRADILDGKGVAIGALKQLVCHPMGRLILESLQQPTGRGNTRVSWYRAVLQHSVQRAANQRGDFCPEHARGGRITKTTCPRRSTPQMPSPAACKISLACAWVVS